MSSPAEDLSAHLDGELGSEEEAALQARLLADSGCRSDLAKLAWVRELYASWEPVAPPAGFPDRFQNRLAAELGAFSSWRVQRFATAAMLLLAVGALVFASYYDALNAVAPTLDSALTGSMDPEVLDLASLEAAELSKDRVLDMMLTGNVR